jgi:hypothetical protein
MEEMGEASSFRPQSISTPFPISHREDVSRPQTENPDKGKIEQAGTV